MRSWKTAVGVSVAAVLGGAGVGVVASVGSAASGTPAGDAPSAGQYQVAPYVDLSANSANMLDTAISQGGLKSYTAAFVIGSACKPIWGDTLGVENSTVNAKISAAKSAGASAIISFGGAGGVELAQSCTDVSALTAAYQSVIDKYGVDHVDFDVEGAAIADPASVDRRYRAIKALQGANAGLKVSVTIPVLPDGPDGNGAAFLKAAATSGVRLDVVNAMTMDYGRPVADMATAAQTAAEGTLAAAKAAGLPVTYANIGITPMIGQNDSAGEVVSQADARKIVSWAREKGVGRLSFWSIGRDQPCAGGGVSPNCSGLGGSALEFTKIFLEGAGGGSPSSSGEPTAPSPSGPSASSSPSGPSSSGEPTAPSGSSPSTTSGPSGSPSSSGPSGPSPSGPSPSGPSSSGPTSSGPSPSGPSPSGPSPSGPSPSGPSPSGSVSGGPSGSASTAPATTTGATGWAPNRAYRVGDLVSFEQATYRCRQAHTSLETWQPTVTPALWHKL